MHQWHLMTGSRWEIFHDRVSYEPIEIFSHANKSLFTALCFENKNNSMYVEHFSFLSS